MNFIRTKLDAVRSKFEVATREFAKFGIIGAVNFVLDIALWNLLVQFVMPDAEVKAKVIASLVATTSSYFMNRHWTFRHRTKAALHREYVLFFFFNAVALGMQAGSVAIAKYGMDINSIMWLNIINLLGIAAGTAFRFWSYRRFVWLLPKDEPAEVPATAEPVTTDAPATASPAGTAAPPTPNPALATSTTANQ